jgi:hypothetical protein
MRRVKFQEGGQARSGVTNEPVGQNFRRLLQRMIEPSAPSAEPSQRPLERARRTQRPSNPPATPSRPPASGANFPGETVQPAPPRGEDRQAFMERTMREEDDRTAAARQSAQRPNRPAAPRRPAPARQREMTPEERHAFMVRTMQEEADREAAARQPERGFFERLGLRRTNETGMEPGTEARMRDMYGSQYSSQYNMKKGGMIKAYREGGAIRQGMQSPKAQEGRAEMAEDVMRRERAREPISDKERKAGRAEAAMDSGPLTDAEKERMRSSGFKKGGMIKPKGHGMKEEAMEMKGGRYRGGMKEEMAEMRSMSKMKKGGAVKKAAGGKVAAPKKMMKGGMTSKPKKMMGGGRAMYAKGGMAKGCK